MDAISNLFSGIAVRKWIATLRGNSYVEVIGENGLSDGGTELTLDWNQKFIDELAKEGIEADSDEDMVQIWLQSIMREDDIEAHEEHLLNEAKENTRKAQDDL